MEYMNNDFFSGYAILLHGKWGCGKTFFCKQLIERENISSRDIWYISMFGIKEKSELDEKIFEAAHPILSSESGKGMASIGYSLIRTACKYKCGFDTNEIADSLSNFLKKNGSKLQCRLLIIDDLERVQMPIGEIFGYFSSWLSDGIRILLVCNEDEIPKDRFEEYYRYKEKIIGESYEVLPEYGKVVEKLWVNLNLPENPAFTQFALEACKCVGKNNLRSVNQVLNQWNIIYERLEESYKECEDVIFDFFRAYLIIKIQYQANSAVFKCNNNDKDEFEKRTFFCNKCHEAWMAFKIYQISLMEYEKEYKNEKSKLAESYKMDMIICPLVLFDSWYELLISGKELDGAWINSRIKILYERKQKDKEIYKKINTSLKKISTVIGEQSGNIQKLAESLFLDFKEGRYVTLSECMKFIRVYLELIKDEILPTDKYSVEFLVKILEDYITQYGTKISYDGDGEPVPEWSNIPQMNNMDTLSKLINQIYELARNNYYKDMDKAFNDKEMIFSLINNPTNAINKYLDTPILKKINIDSLFEWLESENNKRKHEDLLIFLQHRYGLGIANMGLSKVGCADYDSVKVLREHYEKRYRETRHKFLLEVKFYKYYMDKYDNLLSYMESEINSLENVTSVMVNNH